MLNLNGSLLLTTYWKSTLRCILYTWPVKQGQQVDFKIATLGKQEPQPAGTAKWPITFYKRFTGHDFLQVVFIF